MSLLGVFVGSLAGSLLLLAVMGVIEARCTSMTERYARRKLYGGE
jgi:hypothetical protein